MFHLAHPIGSSALGLRPRCCGRTSHRGRQWYLCSLRRPGPRGGGEVGSHLAHGGSSCNISYLLIHPDALPSLSSARTPCSCQSCAVTLRARQRFGQHRAGREGASADGTYQKDSRFFMMSARTAPPKKTMCFLRGGSSILILNFCASGGPIQQTVLDYAAESSPVTHVQSLWVTAEHPRQVQLLHLLLQPARESGVHARASGEDDVLVQLAAHIDRGGLDRVKEALCVQK